MSLQIAETIRQQIGNRAFYMMGAKNLTGDTRSLTWKVGRNSKGVTHVRVELDWADTYTVEFLKVGRAPHYEITRTAVREGIYFDQLRPVIEAETGLRLSL